MSATEYAFICGNIFWPSLVAAIGEVWDFTAETVEHELSGAVGGITESKPGL